MHIGAIHSYYRNRSDQNLTTGVVSNSSRETVQRFVEVRVVGTNRARDWKRCPPEERKAPFVYSVFKLENRERAELPRFCGNWQAKRGIHRSYRGSIARSFFQLPSFCSFTF